MPNYLHRINLVKYLLCLFIPFSLVFNAFSQEHKPTYTLLWRISGKELKQPSYLFGTMHVKDKRVFNFSDSVMLAIQKCDGFALEVHPDTIVREMFESMGKTDSTHDLHKILSKKEYETLAKKFEERKGYKMRDDIDPLMIESLLQNDKDKPGDKETFIDAHLYGIARTMGKNIYGLENASQQFNKLMGSTDEMRERIMGLLENGGEDGSEEMIKIYSTGNLDNILAFVNKYEMADSELVARNKVMVSSMISDMRKGTLFTAVGAAHLPGDEGIIAMLQAKGYTLTPVTATFTGVANRYHVDYGRMKWVTHTDHDMGFSLDYPSEPVKTDVYSGISTWIFADMGNENFYGIYVFPKGSASNPANREQVINNLVRSFNKNKKEHIISRKNTVVNGLPCVDMIIKNSDGYQRVGLFVSNNMLYYLYMGNHLNSLSTAYANRFFNSFKSFPVTEKQSKEWITFKNDTAAFSIKLPATPSRMNRDVENPKQPGQIFKINMFVSSDTANLLNYLIRYNDYPEGSYLANKNAIFNELTGELGGKAKAQGKPQVIWKDGYEGRELKLIFDGGYHGIIRIYIRGNRLYMLLKENLHEDEETSTDDPFFDSFTFIPFTQPAYVNFEPAGRNYKIKMAAKPKVIADSTSDYNSYLKKWSYYTVTSPTSGGVYSLEHATIGKYYRATDLDSLYKTFTSMLVKYTDTLIKTDTVIIAGKKGREFISQNRLSKDQKRSRILIDGGDLFLLQGYLAKEQLFNEESNTFYTSLERTGPAAQADLFSPKADKIMEGLRSADTSEYGDALGALKYYDFTKDELPLMYKALQREYTDDTSLMGARYKLIGVLRNVHDNKTSGQLQDLYNSLKNRDILKAEILNIIPAVDSLKGYDTYFDLLLNTKPLKVKNNYMIFRPLYDSLEFTAAHFQQLIPLIKDSTYHDNIVALASNLVTREKEEYNKLIRDNFVVLTAGAYDELKTYVASKDTNKNEYDINTYKYLNMMHVVKNASLVNAYTNYYLAHLPKGYYVTQAVTARIANRLPVNAHLLATQLDSLDTRFEIMEAYYNEKQLAKVPLKYSQKDEFGRLCLYRVIMNNDDDDFGAPEKLTLLGSVTDKGAVYYAYKFKQSGRDAKATYIGIAGPFKPGAALNFKSYNAYTNYDIKSTNWINQAKALIPELKKSYKVE